MSNVLVGYFVIDVCPYYIASIVYLTFPFDIYIEYNHYTKCNLLLLPYFFSDVIPILSLVHSLVFNFIHTLILSVQ